MTELKSDIVKADMTAIQSAMIHLVTCGIHGTVPDTEKLRQVDWVALYRMASHHSLTAICYMALETGKLSGLCPNQELMKKWREAKEKAIRKNLLLDVERREICNYMEQQGIWYMPLKGVILKGLYPKTGMRQMADNDILFDATFQWQLKEMMEKRGFKASSVGKGNHDVYEKPPVYNYEMHTSLYGKAHKKGWAAYYADVKNRLILDEGSMYGYHFSNEDFYVYIVSHAYKHFDGSGTGIRSLVDLYVFLQKKQSELDWDYMTQELKVLGIAEFEHQSRMLGEKLFGVTAQELTEEEQVQLQYFLSSGTYGIMQHRIEKQLRTLQPGCKSIQKQTKWKYILQRMFPEKKWFRQYIPVCDLHPWLIPFYRIFRLVRGVICRSKRIRTEIRAVCDVEKLK